MDESLHLDDWLGKRIRVVMDRPLGTKHPEWGFVYELNYGYVPNTLAPRRRATRCLRPRRR